MSRVWIWTLRRRDGVQQRTPVMLCHDPRLGLDREIKIETTNPALVQVELELMADPLAEIDWEAVARAAAEEDERTRSQPPRRAACCQCGHVFEENVPHDAEEITCFYCAENQTPPEGWTS